MIPTNQTVYDHIKSKTHVDEVLLVKSLRGAFDWGSKVRNVDLMDMIRTTRRYMKETKND